MKCGKCCGVCIHAFIVKKGMLIPNNAKFNGGRGGGQEGRSKVEGCLAPRLAEVLLISQIIMKMMLQLLAQQQHKIYNWQFWVCAVRSPQETH